jgi:hypothetical protein
MLMSDIKFNENLCKNCGESLFPDKKDCKEFIEGKLKDGFIVCSCCGSKDKPDN